MRVAVSSWPTLLGAALLLAPSVACRPDRSGLGASDGGAGFDSGWLDGRAGAGGAWGQGGAGSGAGGGGAAGGGAGGAGAAGGSGGRPDAGDASAGGDLGPGSVMGCSDGTREGYVSTQRFPDIAACAGGWEVAGLADPLTRTPTCERQGGNNGTLADGFGCTVTDLCAEGWHVCESAQEVVELGTNCDDAIPSTTPGFVFFVTRQRAFGLVCLSGNNLGTTNLHGCGNAGVLDDNSCAPFTVMLRDLDCTLFPPWSCASTLVREFEAVTKRGSTRGGVLCCRD
jgi:hypothetical protein